MDYFFQIRGKCGLSLIADYYQKFLLAQERLAGAIFLAFVQIAPARRSYRYVARMVRSEIRECICTDPETEDGGIHSQDLPPVLCESVA